MVFRVTGGKQSQLLVLGLTLEIDKNHFRLHLRSFQKLTGVVISSLFELIMNSMVNDI